MVHSMGPGALNWNISFLFCLSHSVLLILNLSLYFVYTLFTDSFFCFFHLQSPSEKGKFISYNRDYECDVSQLIVTAAAQNERTTLLWFHWSSLRFNWNVERSLYSPFTVFSSLSLLLLLFGLGLNSSQQWNKVSGSKRMWCFKSSHFEGKELTHVLA